LEIITVDLDMELPNELVNNFCENVNSLKEKLVGRIRY
jgi:hypothetical protein